MCAVPFGQVERGGIYSRDPPLVEPQVVDDAFPVRIIVRVLKGQGRGV